MRIRIDESACCGDGNCVDVCPEVFEIDPATGLAQLLPGEPPEALRAKVSRAIEECPTAAIALE